MAPPKTAALVPTMASSGLRTMKQLSPFWHIAIGFNPYLLSTDGRAAASIACCSCVVAARPTQTSCRGWGTEHSTGAADGIAVGIADGAADGDADTAGEKTVDGETAGDVRSADGWDGGWPHATSIRPIAAIAIHPGLMPG